jgi:cyanate lyase
MPSRATPAVVNHLSRVLRRRGITWTDLARRTLLPAAHLARLRVRHSNPQLAVAQRVAAALDLPVEAIWRLVQDPPCRR